MERVSGWYKRQNQWIIVLIAVAITVGLNVDTVRIAKTLRRETTLREALLRRVGAATQDTSANAIKYPQELDTLIQKLPLGWNCSKGESDDCWPLNDGLRLAVDKNHFVPVAGHIVGLVLTLIALSLGAPFWFDLLNKLVNLRHTGVPPDEQRPKKLKGEG